MSDCSSDDDRQFSDDEDIELDKEEHSNVDPIMEEKEPNDESVKKRKVEIPDTNLEPFKDDFYFKTTRTSDLQTCFKAICKVPGLKPDSPITIEMNEKSLLFYVRQHGIIVRSFWKPEAFQQFYCKKPYRMDISKNRLEGLQKKMSDSSEYIEIKPANIKNTNQQEGIIFGGKKAYKKSKDNSFGSFEVYISAVENPTPTAFPPKLNLNWEIVDVSHKMADDLSNISKSVKFTTLHIQDKRISWKSVSDIGDTSEVFEHELSTSNNGLNVDFTFVKKYITVVTTASRINDQIKIHFSDKQGQKKAPVIFEYSFCNTDDSESIIQIVMVPTNK